MGCMGLLSTLCPIASGGVCSSAPHWGNSLSSHYQNCGSHLCHCFKQCAATFLWSNLEETVGAAAVVPLDACENAPVNWLAIAPKWERSLLFLENMRELVAKSRKRKWWKVVEMTQRVVWNDVFIHKPQWVKMTDKGFSDRLPRLHPLCFHCGQLVCLQDCWNIF